ncbi:MAG TPA: glycosyltransferase family 4 protein [Gemmatimonadaceae bacterium]|nr:glycosyltransferase family 4 protein [Gemmatimonadaceae bacterium]
MTLPRILHVDSGRSWRGGQRQVLLLAAGLHDRGYRTLVVGPFGSPLVHRAERAGLPTYRLTLRGEWDIRRARELRAVAREWGADIIHAHDARSHSIALLARLFARKPRLVVTRRVAFPPKRVALKYGRRVDAFIAISQAVRNAMVVAGVKAERIEVVYSGVPAPQLKEARDWRSERGWPVATIVCGIVGAMTREKGLDSIGAIAKGLPTEVRARIRIVLLGGKGKGEFISPELEGFDAGFVEEIHDAMAGLDLLWHPARSEGLGTAVIDAMALGVPPIAFAVGGLPEVIQDGVSGRLIAPGSVSTFSEAIGDLVTDEALRTRLAEGARNRAGQFDAQAMIDRTAEVYQRVTAG